MHLSSIAVVLYRENYFRTSVTCESSERGGNCMGTDGNDAMYSEEQETETEKENENYDLVGKESDERKQKACYKYWILYPIVMRRPRVLYIASITTGMLVTSGIGCQRQNLSPELNSILYWSNITNQPTN
jgi:hypothetical protein